MITMISNKFKTSFKLRGSATPTTKDDILNTLDKFGNKEKTPDEDMSSNGVEESSPSCNDTDSACDDDSTHRTYSQSQSFSNSYCDEWERLFNRPDFMKPLRRLGVEGQLRSSRFRSICWRLYLDVLPENREQWTQHTREWRQKYTRLKEKYITEPQSELEQCGNVVVNNPLSQDKESPWNRYFQDNELKVTIRQDVIRTYPKLEFFNAEFVRTLMVDALFIYAKLNPIIEYRQGMHELLAPVIFVLHCDHQAFQHACELESVGLFSDHDREIAKELLDPEYLEHDAFAMFSQIMETVEPWYHSREYTPPTKADVIVHAQPFMKPQDMQPSNMIVNKLSRIQDCHLKRIDLELYLHLDRLDIAPQIYGIRWLRLLFGREFPMQDLLVVWDVIFANSISFDLVDYVFVAMLQFIREIILSSDYPECLGTLMRFPPVGDVHWLLELALHLRSPELYPRPPKYTAQRYSTSRQDDLYHYHNSSKPVQRSQSVKQTRSTSSSSTASDLASKFRAASVLNSFSTLTRRKSNSQATPTSDEAPRPVNLQPQPLHKSSSEPMYLLTDSSPSPDEARKLRFGKGSSANLNKGDMTSQASSDFRQSSAISGRSREMKTIEPGRQDAMVGSFVNIPGDGERNGRSSPRRTESPVNNKQPGMERARYLQGRINELESMCKYCASKMDVHIEKLEAQLVKQSCLENEDEVFLALAGVKQVRDVLKGTLRFAHNMLDHDEININDDHYTAEPRPDYPPEPRPESLMSMSLDSQSLNSSRRNSDEKTSASIFYVESPQESEKSFSRKGDESPSSRMMSDEEFSHDLDNTIAKIMTLTRRDEDFNSSTELKDIENNVNLVRA